MKRSPGTSRAAVEFALNRLTTTVKELLEGSDPLAMNDLLEEILSSKLQLADLWDEDTLHSTSHDTIRQEQELLDDYNQFKKMIATLRRRGFKFDILRMIDVHQEMERFLGSTSGNLSGEQLFTDLSYVSETSGGTFASIYTLYLYREFVERSCSRRLSVAEKLNDKGYGLAQRGEYSRAIGFYKNAIDESPGFSLAWVNLGIAYKNLHQLDNAIRCYDHVLEKLDNRYKKSLHNKAVALAMAGRQREALLCCEHALSIDPEYKAALRFKSEFKRL